MAENFHLFHPFINLPLILLLSYPLHLSSFSLFFHLATLSPTLLYPTHSSPSRHVLCQSFAEILFIATLSLSYTLLISYTSFISSSRPLSTLRRTAMEYIQIVQRPPFSHRPYGLLRSPYSEHPTCSVLCHHPTAPHTHRSLIHLTRASWVSNRWMTTGFIYLFFFLIRCMEIYLFFLLLLWRFFRVFIIICGRFFRVFLYIFLL